MSCKGSSLSFVATINGDRKGQLLIPAMLLLDGVRRWQESLLQVYRRRNIGMTGRFFMGKYSSSQEMVPVVRGENWWYGRRRRSVHRG